MDFRGFFENLRFRSERGGEWWRKSLVKGLETGGNERGRYRVLDKTLSARGASAPLAPSLSLALSLLLALSLSIYLPSWLSVSLARSCALSLPLYLSIYLAGAIYLVPSLASALGGCFPFLPSSLSLFPLSLSLSRALSLALSLSGALFVAKLFTLCILKGTYQRVPCR